MFHSLKHVKFYRANAVLLLLLAFSLLLSGCQASGKTETNADAAGQEKLSSAADTEEIFSPAVRVPVADGSKTLGNTEITIDISHTDEGYLMAAYHGNAAQVNVQITGPDHVVYLYYISQKETYTAMPLSSGEGTYLIDIYEQVEGDIYSHLLSEVLDVSLKNEFMPFLYANQFVSFTEDTQAVQKGIELAQGCASDLDITTNIYNYVVSSTSYDYDKAASVTSPYYPDVDETLRTHKGICFDYSALMCAMLRTQGIPCKLNIGYADDIYHAWISVYLQSVGWVDHLIQFNGKDWSMMDPTFASSNGGSFDPSEENYTLMFQR